MELNVSSYNVCIFLCDGGVRKEKEKQKRIFLDVLVEVVKNKSPFHWELGFHTWPGYRPT